MAEPRSSSLTLTFSDRMDLTDLLNHYTRAVECSPRYAESLRRTVRKAQGSGLQKICQLSPDAVNEFLANLPLGPTTRHNIRRELLTLWRHAYDLSWTDIYPARIRKIRAEYAPVRAWTPLQLESMIEVASKDETRILQKLDIRRCDVIPVWIRLNYETGIRFEDMHNLGVQDFSNGCINLREHKTRKPTTKMLSDQAQVAVARLFARSPDGTLFRWFLTRRRAFHMWREFLDKNGFGGSTKWFRRAAATQVHRKKRGAAQEFLQHSCPQLALRHYIDWTQIDDHIAPPPLSR